MEQGRRDVSPDLSFDVLIIGAGISGVDAAVRLAQLCPGRSFAVFEARDRIGGTWDLFRFPGIRSDSDMYTLGFPFRPWRGEKAIADGESIRAYVEDTAREMGVETHIRFGHRVIRASFSSAQARWEVEAADWEGNQRLFDAAFVYFASGYFDYALGHRPAWVGEEKFGGAFIHPQFWPEDVLLAGRKLLLIGSGATAVTMAPALAAVGASVTMLQRSPSYIVSRPSRDALADRFRRLLPARAAGALARWKNVLLGSYFYNRARQHPERAKRTLRKLLEQELDPKRFDLDRHFTPRYDVWDQRLCLVPDGDLFEAMRQGGVTIVTGEIERFDEAGARLVSGEHIAADLVVTATGLEVKLLGGIAVDVDGTAVDPATRLIYKGTMLSGVPNAALAFGYVNASWTLRCDLTARFFCRLLNHMEKKGHSAFVADAPEGAERRPLLEFTSGYVQRASAHLPRQGTDPPWRVHQNYRMDRRAMAGPIEDNILRFTGAAIRPVDRGGSGASQAGA